MEEKEYSLLKDVKLEINGTFSLCFWLYLPTSTQYPSLLLRQLHPGITCSVPFLVLNEQKKLMLFPLVFLHQEAPTPGDSTLFKENTCASATIEFPVNKWVHVGCEISADFVRLHIDGLIVGEKPLFSTLNKDSHSDGSRKVSLACTHGEADENHEILGYVHGVEVLPPTSSIKSYYAKDPPLQLSIDSSSASDIEEDKDGVWSIVGGKASCRRNFSLDVILLDAFGQPVNKGVEVVSSLFYADSEAPVEKTNDAEAPLLTIYDGIEFASWDRPSKLINGRASFKLKISQEMKSCAVGCIFGYDSEKKPDAAIGLGHTNGAPGVLRSMESAQYYAENNIDYARGRGYSIVMTTSLSSDVPVGYFSWAEYDIMAPMQPKTEKALAAAFISNCAARNFRLQALEGLEKANIKIDSYGGCHRNRDGRVDKVQTLKRYKFSLAFENSDEEDYVTEKFFQSLVAGTIPVVVGAPNIQEFAPSPDAVLHIKELKDIALVAKTMKYLAEHPDAYNQSLRWKFEGPSDSFKALVDMAAVHSSCRLCIYLATMIRQTEEKSLSFSKRPCKCTRGLETVYHVYVRERGRFEMVSIFLRSRNLSLKALESAVLLKFKSLKHVPIWKEERPESIRGTNELKVYRIYPLGLTQRQALYTFSFKGDNELRSHLENNPCAKFEVIFV